MKIKSKAYMQSSEFKERQGSFAFYCAQAFDYLMKFKAECLEGWKTILRPMREAAAAVQLPFAFFAVYSDQERKPA